MPALGGILSIVGMFYEKNFAVDLGISLSAVPFFYFMHDLSLTYGNLFFILLMYFLYFGLWSFMRRAVLIYGIEKDHEGNKERDLLIQYKEDSARYIVSSLILGSITAVLGSLIAIYSFVGPFPAWTVIFLMISLSIGVIFTVYLVVVLLPKYFMIKESSRKKGGSR